MIGFVSVFPEVSANGGNTIGRARQVVTINPERYLLNPENPYFVKTITKKNDVLVMIIVFSESVFDSIHIIFHFKAMTFFLFSMFPMYVQVVCDPIGYSDVWLDVWWP